MKDGLSFSVDVNEFALAAILIVVLALGVGYEYIHRPLPIIPVPAPTDACASKEPTITIEQTFYIPVPAPAVVPPAEFTPDPNLDKPPVPHEDDDNQPIADPSRQVLLSSADLPPRKGVTIPDSLRRP